MKALGSILVSLITGIGLASNPITGKVITIIDGNTVVVKAESETYQVVLCDVDSPEAGQPFAEEAKAYLKKVLLNKNITLELCGKDRRGNYMGVLYLNTSTDLRHELVRKGLAWVSEKCEQPELLQLQSLAQQAKAGLWSHEAPTPPWVFRRQQSMMTAKGS
jgi:micrococcal nuclease